MDARQKQRQIGLKHGKDKKINGERKLDSGEKKETRKTKLK